MPARPGRRGHSRLADAAGGGANGRTVGAHVFEARLRANLTQSELYDRSGVAVSSISAIENDKVRPQLGTLRLFATVFGADWLAGARQALNGKPR